MSWEQERVRDSVSGFPTAPLLDPPQRRGLSPSSRTLPDRVTRGLGGEGSVRGPPGGGCGSRGQGCLPASAQGLPPASAWETKVEEWNNEDVSRWGVRETACQGGQHRWLEGGDGGGGRQTWRSELWESGGRGLGVGVQRCRWGHRRVTTPAGAPWEKSDVFSWPWRGLWSVLGQFIFSEIPFWEFF